MYLFCPLNALLLSTTVMLYMLTLLILSIIEFADFFYVAAYFDPSLLHFFSHTHLQQTKIIYNGTTNDFCRSLLRFFFKENLNF